MRSRIPPFTQCVGPGDVHSTVLTQLTQDNTQNWFLHSDHEMLELATADLRCSSVSLFRCSGVPAFLHSTFQTLAGWGRAGGRALQVVNQQHLFGYECEESI